MQKFEGGGRIKPLLKIINECRSLKGVGELNPYWRSSMNVEDQRIYIPNTLVDLAIECKV